MINTSYNKLVPFLIFISLIFNCKNFNKSNQETLDYTEKKSNKFIDYTTVSMEFKGPDTIPSGWNSIKYENKSNETHFLVFEKYPEGKTIDSTKSQVFPVFDKGMDLINAGKNEEGFTAFNSLPAWFFQVAFNGGVGLVSPNEKAISTIQLNSGRYLIECYVKMPNGKFHSVMGMCKEIIVSDASSGIEEPKPTLDINISSEKGIEFNPSIKSGKHIIRVNFLDQKLHEHFLGHDVNLVRLNETANLEELESWMNWATPKGLITPAPQGVTFLGGLQEMPSGHKGYFSVELKKGKYALVSEVPASKSKNMFKVFEVLD
ncbi:hypothetical protein SAMN05428642_10459 [Flaviramulus basaltis]|uniref:Uncharacterized protein n=1 Tax=Flaviramulus basaltis TaxID=369401 RepID=A0A1K2IPE4_9FLAO|nr:hypothetical protein [Flaviramulus basaltis]SFZ94305.1 hypothetical protein SAMN05428642_10459 [Flaviramulus basaltis]